MNFNLYLTAPNQHFHMPSHIANHKFTVSIMPIYIIRLTMAHCVWKVPLGSGNHVIEFLHGTTTGSRQIKVDGIEMLKHDWMFRLVGEEKVERKTEVTMYYYLKIISVYPGP